MLRLKQIVKMGYVGISTYIFDSIFDSEAQMRTRRFKLAAVLSGKSV